MDNKAKKCILLIASGIVMMVASTVIMVLHGSPEPPRYEMIAIVPLFVGGGWHIVWGAWGLLGVVKDKEVISEN